MLLVLLDENFDATEIYEADRAPVEAALMAPGSKARNERGALAVSKFKTLGRCRWRRDGTPSNVSKSNVDVSAKLKHEAAPSMATQRDKMRELFTKYKGDQEGTVHAYAAAEKNRDVRRASNNYGIDELEYARRLYTDGVKKGWLK